MCSKSILFYYHSRYCCIVDESLVVPKFQYYLQKFNSDGFKIFYIPRQGTSFFPNNRYSIIPVLHELSINIDAKISTIFYQSRPLPGFFERFYWLIWIICLRPCLVVGFEPSQELCWICKVFKIPSVDIEHGIRDFCPVSGSYFYRNTYRYKGSILPDFLLTTFNEEILSSSFFNNFNPKPSLINVGDLEAAFYINNLNIDNSYASPLETCDTNLSVIILSAYISRYDPIAKLLPDFVVDFIRQISSNIPLNLTIRLHPKTFEDHNARLISITRLQRQLYFLNNVFFEEQSQSSLVSSLLAHQIVMTHESSALKTALLLEKTTIYWSTKLITNQIDPSSCQYLFNLNISNVQDLASFAYERRSSNSFDFSQSRLISKADDAYNLLTSLCV